jgi:hypothetical protein
MDYKRIIVIVLAVIILVAFIIGLWLRGRQLENEKPVSSPAVVTQPSSRPSSTQPANTTTYPTPVR